VSAKNKLETHKFFHAATSRDEFGATNHSHNLTKAYFIQVQISFISMNARDTTTTERASITWNQIYNQSKAVRELLTLASLALLAAIVGFVALAGIQEIIPKAHGMPSVVAAQLLCGLIVLSTRKEWLQSVSLGFLTVATLAAGTSAHLVLFATAWIPVIYVQFQDRSANLKFIAVASQVLSMATVHDATGFSGFWYWTPLIFTLAVGVIAVARANQQSSRIAQLCAIAFVAFFAYA
jgi:hypothetical protein